MNISNNIPTEQCQSCESETPIDVKDNVSEKKKEQIKDIIEKMEQEGRPIDWATIVLC